MQQHRLVATTLAGPVGSSWQFADGIDTEESLAFELAEPGQAGRMS